MNKLKLLLKAFLFETFMIIVIFLLVFVAGLVDIKSNEQIQNGQMLKDMKESLQQDKKCIEDMNTDLVKKDSKIKSLQKQITSLDKTGDVEKKNDLIIEYNKEVKEYKSQTQDYNERVKQYDNTCKQYKSIGGKGEGLTKWIKSIIGT